MPCIFCNGEEKLTREHIIPLWLGDLLHRAQPPAAPATTGKRFTHRFTPGSEDTTPAREWSTDEVDLLTKSVCGRCNHGWLADLETEARPLLGRLVLGEPTALSSADQKLLATWGYKTLLLFQLIRAQSARAIPPDRFRQLFAERRPSAEARLWLGAAQSRSAARETSTEVKMVNVQHQVPGFFSALALGRLLILCAGRLSPGPEQLQAGSRGRTSVTIQVWPASLRTVPWPPPEALENLDAEYLVGLV